MKLTKCITKQEGEFYDIAIRESSGLIEKIENILLILN